MSESSLAVEIPLAYSVNEACEMLGIHRDLLYELIGSGQLRSVKLGSRRLIPRAALLALLEQDDAS